MTTNERLRARIRELETAAATTTAVSGGEVFEVRFPVPGHSAGPDAYIAIKRHGEAWGVFDNNLGFGPQAYLDGRRCWQPMAYGVAINAVHRWPKQQAEQLAAQAALLAAERHLLARQIHTLAVNVESAVGSVREMADAGAAAAS